MKRKLKTITEEEIYDLYVVQQKSQRQIAKELQIGQTSVRRLLEKFDIKSRTPKESKQTPSYLKRNEELAERYREEYTKYYTKRCEYCGKEFVVTSSQKRKKFCSEECVNNSKKVIPEKQYCKHCGKEIVMTGRWYKRVYCDDCVNIGKALSQVNRIETTCGFCGKPLKVIPSVYNANKYCYCDADCMAQHYAEIYTGENSPTWKGGKSHHYAGGFYHARKKARKRDNYTCQLCGVTEEEFKQEMSVHHIKNYRDFEDKKEANKLDNLVCLCESCHRFVHSNNNTDNIYIR